MTQRKNCLAVIDELHKLAHSGAFDNIDISVVEKATDAPTRINQSIID